MKFDFDRSINRQNTYDLKWNKSLIEMNLHATIPDDFVPMWIADADFACPPHVIEAMKARADKEIYGYCAPLPPFYKAVCWWQQQRHGYSVESTSILAIPSVVAGINIAIRTMTNEGDGVIIQPPVYDPFASIVKRTNRKVVCNTLKSVNGRYEMDFDLLEKQAKDPENKLLILCSPHNPVGRVWSVDELKRLADICIANGVTIVSDEIHSDIVFEGKHYPLPALSEEYAKNTILLTAPSKTFNVPGLKMSIAIIPNPELKKAFEATQLSMSLDVRNTFGLESIVSCYSPESEPWLDEEISYLKANADFVQSFLAENLPQVTMCKPEGTFLCWLDCSALGLSDDALIGKVALQAGVICIPGPWFGQGGEQHLRLNIACTKSNLQKALERIAKAFK